MQNISSTDPSSSGSAASARKLAKTTRKAARLAPAKVRSAMNTMASYYEAVGNAGNNPAKLAEAAKLVGKYTKAFGVYTAYFLKTCVNTS